MSLAMCFAIAIVSDALSDCSGMPGVVIHSWCFVRFLVAWELSYVGREEEFRGWCFRDSAVGEDVGRGPPSLLSWH